MGRPPIAVIVAAILTGLLGVAVLVFTGFLWLLGLAWETDRQLSHVASAGLASAALLGILIIVGAVMVVSGSYRWAVALAVFNGLVLVLEMALRLATPVDAPSYRPMLAPSGLLILMWNLVPLVCLLLPSSRRWFRRRALETA